MTRSASHVPDAVREAVTERAGRRCEYCLYPLEASLLSFEMEHIVPFYNPRTQRWADHFRLDGAQIVPLTPEARVTVAILQLNHPDRLIERERLIQIGRYP